MSKDSVYYELIRDLRALEGLPAALRERLAEIIQQISKLRTIAKGSVIFRESTAHHNTGYVLLEGAVGILKTDAPKHRCDAPELIGEIMQFNPAHTRTATVGAVEDCTVYRFEWDEFWNAANEAFTAEEVDKIRSALESRAWQHFTE